jgi:hypothetical protein
VHEPAALGNEVRDFRGIDLVHLAGDEEASDGYFFGVVVVEREGKLVEDGDGQILSVLLYLFVEVEDPLNGVFSMLIVEGLDRVVGGVGRVGEGWQRGAFLQQFV